MYKNLKAEMSRYDIKNEDIASKLNITPSTASLKVNGKAKVTLQEAWSIQDLFLEKASVNFTLDYLFEI
jgi:plasmid maintenance system antidote protein VapI